MNTAQTYVFNRNKSVFFDFLTFLNNISRFPSIRGYYADLGLRLPEAIYESYRSIMKNIPADFISSLLFPRKIGKISFLCYAVPAEKLVCFDSIDDFLNEFLRLPQDELKIRMLEFYGSGPVRTDKYYAQLLENPEALTDYINGLSCCEQQKWNLISFLNSHRPLTREIEGSLNAMKCAFETEYKKHEKNINARYDEIIASCDGNPDLLLRGRLESYDRVTDSGVKTIVFAVVCSSPYAIDFLVFPSTVYVVLGAFYDKTLRSRENIDFTAYFKGFSDTTRAGVIRLLRYGEASPEDISAALSVPLAQLSHHISVLDSLGIIKCVYKNKRICCSLNISTLEGMAEEFSRFVGELKASAGKTGVF